MEGMHADWTSVGVLIDMLESAARSSGDIPNERNEGADFVGCGAGQLLALEPMLLNRDISE
jgi:hypothetical protein